MHNENAPASLPGGISVKTPKDVVEVPDELAAEVLRMPHSGWREVGVKAITETLPNSGERIEPAADTPVVEGKAHPKG